jgi:enoyl-[acyl-carrier protein] reductase II
MCSPTGVDFCRLIGTRFPVIQDGMGPVSTTALAQAVSRAGGLGTVSSFGTSGDASAKARRFREEIEQVEESGCGSFAVNIPVGRDRGGDILPVVAAYLETVIQVAESVPPEERHLRAVITSAGPAPRFTDRLHEAGLIHIQKVGAVTHATKAASTGVDAVIASGAEMGGHTHARPVHTMVLAPQVISAIDLPVVVSGGIYNAQGLAAVLAMGGAGVAMGSRFAASHDCDWHPAYAARIIGSREGEDMIFPGSLGPIRGLHSAGADQLAALLASGASDEELGQWKEDRIALAMSDGNVDDGLLPAGQCSSAITEMIDVADFIPSMVHGARALLDRAIKAFP